jgi:hypothetical protein
LLFFKKSFYFILLIKMDYQGKRVFFGTDCERYLASLFEMRQEHQGSRFPDLMTDFTKRTYSPALAIEAKSGKNGGKLLAEQFVYGISTIEQYNEFYGEKLVKLDGWFEGETPFFAEPHHLFYNNIHRSDDLVSPEIDRDFSAIKMCWGDQWLIPSEVLFAYFAARMTQKDGYELQDAVDLLKKRTKKRITQESSFSNHRPKEEFQNFELVYSRALFDASGTCGCSTDYQKRVVEKVYDQIPDLDEFPRREFVGPCGTNIHIIGQKEFPELIDQMGEAIGSRRNILTQIADERKAALDLIGRIEPSSAPQGYLFCNGDVSSERRDFLKGEFTEEEISWLERLTMWKTEEDFAKEMDFLDSPTDGIPF